MWHMNELTWYQFFITSLAVWRCVVFIRQDTLWEGTREKLLIALGRRDHLWADKLYELLTCPWCLSVWLAGAAMALWETLIDWDWSTGIITFLALAVLPPVYDQLADKL